ncbi:F-box/FBD/LRR-repeat protein At5g22700-like [Vigna radiata var. radiata]|uniref:F-box/FBD/LRR-repeat protein At5g22700-like n=1 Tax=Vigna radiata var. radiata TaxID=3916 RepID=A0A1S3TE55_VIGRR|nr:F-box/FBD/LRR-repeat protein At5g22700-like [Vigna radiata var. radiata]
MADLISSLPNEIICHILSSLPSQQVVATSVISKRWNLLWRDVPSLHFDNGNEYFGLLKCKKNTFYSSVSSFLAGHENQPFYRLRLRCYYSMYITKSIRTQIQNAVTGSDRIQILDLYCNKNIVIPSVVFSFKTLVTLNLERITVEDISFVDLPLLEILHLEDINSPVEIDLSQFLFGCPNLKDLRVIRVRHLACETKGKFIRLPKLVRACIHKFLLPLEIFKKVEVLELEWVKFHWIFQQPNMDLNFDFHNLIRLELNVVRNWLLVLKLLNHCPKLQSLDICIHKV